MKQKMIFKKILKKLIFAFVLIVWILPRFLSSPVSEKIFLYVSFPLMLVYTIGSLYFLPKEVLDIRIFFIFFIGFVGHFALLDINSLFPTSSSFVYTTIALCWYFFFGALCFCYGIYYVKKQTEFSKVYKPNIKFISGRSTYVGWTKAYFLSGIVFLLLLVGFAFKAMK